jgi:hypothetical protein
LDNNLTATQRRRKIGAGVRNYGFIEKVADLAAANPEYAQFFHPAALRLAAVWMKSSTTCVQAGRRSRGQWKRALTRGRTEGRNKILLRVTPCFYSVFSVVYLFFAFFYYVCHN